MLSKMAATARAAYVVADSSKIGKCALMRFGNIARWQGLITDAAIKRPELAALRRAGVRVRVADSAG